MPADEQKSAHPEHRRVRRHPVYEPTQQGPYRSEQIDNSDRTPRDNRYTVAPMEWLNYHHLLYFWTVAREGSVTRAAAELRLGQPTVSAQIRTLEEALGE